MVVQFALPIIALLFGGRGSSDDRNGINFRSLLWFLIALIGLFLLLRLFLAVADVTILEAVGLDDEVGFVTEFFTTAVDGIKEGAYAWLALGSGIAGFGSSLFSRGK